MIKTCAMKKNVIIFAIQETIHSTVNVYTDICYGLMD